MALTKIFLVSLGLLMASKSSLALGQDCSASFITPSTEYDYPIPICGDQCPMRNTTDFEQTRGLEEGDKVLLVSPGYGCRNYPRGDYKCRTQFENRSGGKIKYTLVRLDVRKDINTCNTRSDRLVFVDVAGPPTGSDNRKFCKTPENEVVVTSLNSTSRANFLVSPGGSAEGFEVLVEALPPSEP